MATGEAKVIDNAIMASSSETSDEEDASQAAD